ncbi:Protein CBG21603 [Caenorhabditis briggsae]|uniref:Mos1 transposase HTH domain-containing protein n=3 Tax=Caenorhabditis briggsae TaxID=6238 RepID=A0AAE9D2X7_CAEBR|nr:Protein CBG21603 [Caenorhabditis briggsae]ULT93499.1 hypothetical protein L3Y34_003177 [Caenorhabditis briggsae]CAP38357.1 Protein CBG21603 [Caenorhabditis briggsae]
MVHTELSDRTSLRLCAKYEFLKRNSAREAHRNICEMLISEKAQHNYQSQKTTHVLRKRRENFRESTETDSDSEEPDDWNKEHDEEFQVDYPIEKLEADFRTFNLYMLVKTEMDHTVPHLNRRMFLEANILERLALRDAYPKNHKELQELRDYNFFIDKNKFDFMNVTREYGKVKTVMGKGDTDVSWKLEHWRCQKDGRTMIWKGYHANFYCCRRFQQWASEHICYCLQRTQEIRRIRETHLKSLKIVTKPRNLWYPAVDPFYKFYQQLGHHAKSKTFIVDLFQLELGWFDDSTEQNMKPTKMLMHNFKSLKKIEFRKWTESLKPENNRVLTMSKWITIFSSNEWCKAPDLDVVDPNIKMDARNFMYFEKIYIHLPVQDIYQFSQQIKEHINKPRMVFEVEEEYNFDAAARVLQQYLRDEIVERKFLLHERKQIYIQLCSDEHQIVCTREQRIPILKAAIGTAGKLVGRS